MSGGRFQYQQHLLGDIADQIYRCIARNGKPQDDDGLTDEILTPKVIRRLRQTADALVKCRAMVDIVDWRLSGDDGDDDMEERWQKEVVNFGCRRCLAKPTGRKLAVRKRKAQK